VVGPFEQDAHVQAQGLEEEVVGAVLPHEVAPSVQTMPVNKAPASRPKMMNLARRLSFSG
jgi:hypothetical protein